MPLLNDPGLLLFWKTHMSFSTELLIVGLLFMIGKPKRGHFALRLGLGVTLYCAFCWSLPFNPQQFGLMRPIVQFLAFAVLLLLVLRVSTKCGIFIALVSYGLQNLAFSTDSFVSSIVNLQAVPQLMMTVLIFAIIYFAAYHLVVAPFNKYSEVYFNNTVCFQLAVVTFCVTCGRMTLNLFNILSDYQLLLLFSIICVVLLLGIQFGLLRQSYEINEKKMIERLLLAEQDRQVLRQETIDIINMKFHDLRYHLNEYRDKNADSRDAEFFDEVADSIKNYDSMPDTGNSALNALLAEKLIYCNANDITVSYMIDASAISMMSPSDIGSLFGNALDNAIQSVRNEEKEKRIISISVRRHNHLGQVIIMNYCSCKPDMKDGLPVSSGDKTIHGFGTRSIRYIAEKYAGNMVFDYNNSMVTLSILLPLADQ